MESTAIKDKDLVAAQLTCAAVEFYAKNFSNVGQDVKSATWYADQTVAIFNYIRTGLEDGKQLPQLPQGR